MKQRVGAGNCHLRARHVGRLSARLLLLLGGLLAIRPAAADLRFGPPRLDFGRQEVGTTSAAQTIAVTNGGPSLVAVRVSTPALGGPNSEEFEVVPSTEAGTCPGGGYQFLQPAAGCRVAVRFRPRSAGLKTASLRFDSSDADTAREVALTGTGVDSVSSAKLVRVSISSSGAQGNRSGHDGLAGSYGASISADGRYIAFVSFASNLVGGDRNDVPDVFVRDRAAGRTELISVASSGQQAHDDAGSYEPSISADGRFVAFVSFDLSLVSRESNGRTHVFVRDRVARTTELISISPSGEPADSSSDHPSISADGRYVAFSSSADNLVPGTTIPSNVFVRDRLAGKTERTSVLDGEEFGGNDPSISADGRYVAFLSSHETSGDSVDSNRQPDIFVRDRVAGTTELISLSPSGHTGNDASSDPSISADGRYVAFVSRANNLVPEDRNSGSDIFVRDRMTGTTELISVSSSGQQGTGSCSAPSISADGRYVVFDSDADQLVPGDNNGVHDVFLRDRIAKTTTRISLSVNGTELSSSSGKPSIDASGRYVAFHSESDDLVPGDTNGTLDVFVWDRLAGSR